MVTAPAVSSLSCPQCGAAITLRALDQAQTVACASCGSVLDARDPNLRVLQAYEKAQKFTPQIPLGTRGVLKGEKWEVVGFQVRCATIDGSSYYWDEYLLFNPYKGFRYLTQYDGHWNDVQVVKAAPTESVNGRQPFVTLYGEAFRHFQTSTADTVFVLGEFPWRVRVGDRAVLRDFVAPPRMLSEEQMPGETTWSLGTYLEPERVWKAFELPGEAPVPNGVYANQPDPFKPVAASMWKRFALFAAILAAFGVVRMVTASRATVFSKSSSFSPARPAESLAYVTPSFAVPGHTANLVLTTETDLDNGWAYFDYALVNEQTGTTYELGREVGYYHGYDSDGAWSEGSQRDRVVLPSVPPGPYFLRVQPQGQTSGATSISYTMVLKRDVPMLSLYVIALLLLVLPPAALAIRAATMESARWKESDYSSNDSGPSSGDDD
jgi:hypothetical protein